MTQHPAVGLVRTGIEIACGNLFTFCAPPQPGRVLAPPAAVAPAQPNEQVTLRSAGANDAIMPRARSRGGGRSLGGLWLRPVDKDRTAAARIMFWVRVDTRGLLRPPRAKMFAPWRSACVSTPFGLRGGRGCAITGEDTPYRLSLVVSGGSERKRRPEDAPGPPTSVPPTSQEPPAVRFCEG